MQSRNCAYSKCRKPFLRRSHEPEIERRAFEFVRNLRPFNATCCSPECTKLRHAEQNARHKEQQRGRHSGISCYLMGADHGPVKIGHSKDPERRLEQLQNGSPYQLKILAILADTDGIRAEERFHERFAHLRQHGEWFDRSVLESLDISSRYAAQMA